MTTQAPSPHERFNQIRDVALFLSGIGGVFHETVLRTGERPTLLILFAAMMGLPAFLRADHVRNTGGPPATGPPPSEPQQQVANKPPTEPTQEPPA